MSPSLVAHLGSLESSSNTQSQGDVSVNTSSSGVSHFLSSSYDPRQTYNLRHPGDNTPLNTFYSDRNLFLHHHLRNPEYEDCSKPLPNKDIKEDSMPCKYN